MKFIQNTYWLINILYQQCWSWTKYQNLCVKTKQGRKNDRHKTVWLNKLVMSNMYMSTDFNAWKTISCIYLQSPFANMFTPSSPFTLQTCLLIPQTIWYSDLGGYRPPERFPISPTNFVIQKFKDRGDICAMSTVKSWTSIRPPSRSQSPATHLPLLYLSEHFATPRISLRSILYYFLYFGE